MIFDGPKNGPFNPIPPDGVHKRLTLFYKHITLKNKCEKVL